MSYSCEAARGDGMNLGASSLVSALCLTAKLPMSFSVPCMREEISSYGPALPGLDSDNRCNNPEVDRIWGM